MSPVILHLIIRLLSFDQSNITISGGNSVPLTSLLQNLTITNSPEGNYLGISRGNSVLLSSAEADGDPTNEIQDLTISSDKLKITKNPLATVWDLTKYLDNTDNQDLPGFLQPGNSGSPEMQEQLISQSLKMMQMLILPMNSRICRIISPQTH